MSLLWIIIKLPAILLAITVHEYAHGRAAYRLGDPTARLQGRLTLNPLRHLDPLGFLCLLLAGFGWAKPVPVNPVYFRNPLQGMMLTSAAGPAANLTAAVALGVLLRQLGPMEGLLLPLLALCVFYNLVLALFNLLPVYPLDGSHVLKGLLPRHLALRYSQHERTFMMGLFVVVVLDVFFDTRIFGRLLLGPTLALFRVIGGDVGALALWQAFGLH